ncbi:glycosyltransferase family 10 domain-containing protein [Candidatus Methylopumilus planktonicus]|uniref:glycosyltransferase family 10 domain-containing protein n=1 Tax=Candidatus Methylopumilus planktonicus TaxID=1581557 RepID=UPI003BEEB8E2
MNFPGSGWVSALYEMAEDKDIKVLSGDIALSEIQRQELSPDQVFILDDMGSKIAKKLLKIGCRPFAISCFESVIYAPFFYDKIDLISNKFNLRLGFGFNSLFEDSIYLVNICKFPAYYRNQLKNIPDWNTRRKVVVVSSNKYLSSFPYIPGRISLSNIFFQIKSLIRKIRSKSYAISLSQSLFNERLQIIHFFLRKQALDIYGSGWENLDTLPKAWFEKLEWLMPNAYKGRCEDKLETLRNYKFAICYENMSSNDYVTEKIIDCFVAGCIPIYMGAPNIKKIISPSSYIDVNDFSDIEEIYSYIDSMSETQAMAMTTSGRNYLASAEGSLYCYENFAERILNEAVKCKI